MENLKRAVKYQGKTGLVSVSRFWMVLFMVMALFSSLNYFDKGEFSVGMTTGGPELSIVGSNVFVLAIYAIVLSFESYYRAFPLLVGLNVSRRNYFLSSLSQSALVVFCLALVQSLLFKLDPFLVKAVKKLPLHEFGAFNTQKDSIFIVMIAIFIAIFAIISIARLFAALSYRFGPLFWGTAFAVLILLPMVSGWVRSLFSRAFAIFFGQLLLTRINGQNLAYLFMIILVFQGLAFAVTLLTDIKERV